MLIKFRKSFRKISLLLAFTVFLCENFQVGALAAAPVTNVKDFTGYAALSGEQVLTGPEIVNLDMPMEGSVPDASADVVTKEGKTWSIPVIWVDENGQRAEVCIPGKKYMPVFVLYVPAGYVIKGEDGSGNYSIKLPEALTSVYGETGYISIVNPVYGITYITSSGILGDMSGVKDGSMLYSPELAKLGTFMTREELESIVSLGNGLADINRIRQKKQAKANETSDSDSDSDSDRYVEEKQEIDLVSIHCSKSVIEHYDRDTLLEIINLIRYVIEPQAVNLLADSFPAYKRAIDNDEIGREIGLYIYDEKYPEDPSKDLKNASAYVQGSYKSDDVYGYFVGVNIDEILDENGEYKDGAIDELKNNMTHEMMHAFMDDYTRTGMEGLTFNGSRYENNNEDSNKFPNWFIEGTASVVDNDYTLRHDQYSLMRKDDNGNGELQAMFSRDLLVDYYLNYSEENGEHPSINSEDKYYDKDNNLLSAYCSGYLAVMYLSGLAVRKEKCVEGFDDYVDENGMYDSEALRGGLNFILEELHLGSNLDSVISYISGGDFTDTRDFADRFIAAKDGTVDEHSADFCVGLLNCLKNVSDTLTEKNGEETFANGSILLPFDTELKTPITDEETEPAALEIIDSSDIVQSTVKEEDTWKTGGTHETAVNPDENDQEDPSHAEDDRIAAIKKSSEDEAAENGDTDKQVDAAESEESDKPDGAVENEGSDKSDDAVENENSDKSDDAVENENSDKSDDAVENDGSDKTDEAADDAVQDTSDNAEGKEEESQETTVEESESDSADPEKTSDSEEKDVQDTKTNKEDDGKK
ncbi:MAG: hypothetical protein IJ803_11065 [Oribacterium sp.]|nr:hypothetical protein [Oribacterium sp.]